jgi:glycosyltransferase involved in cell wall biosynthesis
MSQLKLLSLAVPTCNRANYITHFLDTLSMTVDPHGATIYVSDNSSEDSTGELVSKKMIDFPNIRYFRNEVMLPPDESFERALCRAEGDYVWLLGDTYEIPSAAFTAVREAIEEDEYDLIVVNLEGRVNDVAEKVYTDINELLSEIGWHMTCLSCLIYSRKLLEQANFERYRRTYFLQAGIIFEYLAGRNFKVKWMASHSVKGLRVPGQIKPDSGAMVFEVWARSWLNFVVSLPPAYSIDSKLKCAMDHGFKSRLFRSKNLKRLRFRGILNRESYKQYVRYFPYTINESRLFIKLLAYLPKKLVRHL